MVQQLGTYLRGWRGYFSFCQTPTTLRDLDSWIRRRLRSAIWKQWKQGPTRVQELLRIPAHLGRRFRSMPATHSGNVRPLVPAQAGHLTSG